MSDDDLSALRERAARAERERDLALLRAHQAEASLRGAAPAAIASPAERLRGDTTFTLIQVLLWFQGALWVLGAAVATPAYVMIAYDEAPMGSALPPLAQGLLMAALVIGFFAPGPVGGVVGVVGLRRGEGWGYWVAVVSSGISCLCGCWPFGVAALVLLLLDRVRRPFTEPAR